MRYQFHTHDKIAIEKRTMLRGKIEIESMTHHENHEPWLQVGAPDVSQRFQPPWWSPGWCPLPLHFVTNCPFFLLPSHSTQPREKKVDLTLSRLYAPDFFPPLFLFYLPLKFDKNEWKDAENYCRWEKCDKRTYLFTKRDFYCLHDRAKKCGSTRVPVSPVANNRQISSLWDILLTINWSN